MNLDYYFGKLKDEKPLDNIVTDGGFTSIFTSICCIGDSLSSGEFQHKKGENSWDYVDMYEYSWGQFIARSTGAKVYNYSCGGMTTRDYVEIFASRKGLFNNDIVCKAYIIALGLNDLGWAGVPLGSIDDIDVNDYKNNKKTFAGYMGTIISKYKEISPDAKFFLVTIPKDGDNKVQMRKDHADMLYKIAKLFPHTFVVDLFKYAPDYSTDDFRKCFFLNGHMTPTGYIFSARIIESYIDFIVRHNPVEFKLVGFENTKYYDENDIKEEVKSLGLE